MLTDNRGAHRVPRFLHCWFTYVDVTRLYRDGAVHYAANCQVVRYAKLVGDMISAWRPRTNQNRVPTCGRRLPGYKLDAATLNQRTRYRTQGEWPLRCKSVSCGPGMPPSCWQSTGVVPGPCGPQPCRCLKAPCHVCDMIAASLRVPSDAVISSILSAALFGKRVTRETIRRGLTPGLRGSDPRAVPRLLSFRCLRRFKAAAPRP